MGFHSGTFPEGWIPRILDQIPVAVTVFDLQGAMIYYNASAPKLLRRTPDLLGKDIRLCHEKPASIARIDGIIAGFVQGSREPVSYEASRYGRVLAFTVSPLEVEGRLAGCIHTATPKT
jgi:DUF438 domain-containing protein